MKVSIYYNLYLKNEFDWEPGCEVSPYEWEDLLDISPEDYGEVMLLFFENCPYFLQHFSDTIGKKTTQDLYHLLLHGYVSEEQYKRLKKHIDDTTIESVFAWLDICELNKIPGMTIKLSWELLSEISFGFQVQVLHALSCFDIFEEILPETPSPEKKYSQIVTGAGYAVFFREGQDDYYLSLDGDIYIQRKLYFWKNHNHPVEDVVQYALFEWAGKTYILDFRDTQLIEFEWDFLYDMEALWNASIVIEDAKNSVQTVYGLDSRKEFRKHLRKEGWIIHDVLDCAGEIVILHTKSKYQLVQMSDKKTYRRLENSLHFYSLDREEEVNSFSWHPEQVVSFWNGLGVVSLDTVYIPDRDEKVISREQRHVRIIHTDEKQDLSEPRVSLPLSYDVEMYPTRNDVITIITFPPDKNREIPSYNIVSLTWKIRYLNVSKIEKVVNENGVLEIYFSDTFDGPSYFNSDYNYNLYFNKKPELRSTDLH